MDKIKELEKICRLIRHYIISCTTKAGSGHPTSSLSAVELAVGLLFGNNFHYRIADPSFCNNDRLLFSKGHASPLLYALWTVAGSISENELMGLREFESSLEGHPTKRFKHAEAATGSLGQGLSIGVGMALNAKYLDMLPYKTFVLLGDSEMSEGSVWEAVQVAAHYKLNNLVGIIDVNGLGQSGLTMYGQQTQKYADILTAFGWDIIQIDGHDLREVTSAIDTATDSRERPVMIVAKTIKGKGVSFLENQPGWHGKTLSLRKMKSALKEIGSEQEKELRPIFNEPEDHQPYQQPGRATCGLSIPKNKISTRKAYGIGLVNIFSKFPNIVALDGEVSNSTYSEIFKNHHPNRYYEMFIAEQNMAGTALGLCLRGKIPFVSSFAAFLSRAYDQIRMSQYSDTNIKFIGSHSGVSIGQDGPSQMGLEDMAMFRAHLNMVVLYPSDGISTVKLMEAAAGHKGNVYMRTTRMETPIIYDRSEVFKIGSSKTLKSSPDDLFTVCCAGITVHQALKAYYSLKNEGILIRVIDMYSIKPIDTETLLRAQAETKAIVTVEDHFAEGGLGEAVCSAVSGKGSPVHILAVKKMPKSGRPEQLLDYEGISSTKIIDKIRGLGEQT